MAKFIMDSVCQVTASEATIDLLQRQLKMHARATEQPQIQ